MDNRRHERSRDDRASRFSSLIKQRTGLSFSDAQADRLMEAVHGRMSERKMSCPDEYYLLIARDRLEFIDLVNRLTVNETYFFREPAHLRVLMDRLIPETVSRKKAGERVRILSAGCSTGEEPYSILLAAVEKMGQSAMGLLHLTGVDIDSNAIMRAKTGAYGRQSFRSFDSRLKEKYFESVGQELYRVRDPYRQMVDFRSFNLLTPIYPESLGRMDFVFYRNVSIYFDSPTQRKIFELLASIVSEGGYLITSSTETLSHNLRVLALTEVDGVFMYRKSSPSEGRGDGGKVPFTEPPFPSRQAAGDLGHRAFFGESPALKHELALKNESAPAAPMERAARPDVVGKEGPGGFSKLSESLYEQALAFAKRKLYIDALTTLEEHFSLDVACPKAHVLRANVLTNLERLGEAERACLETLEMDSLCLDAYLLLGLIAKMKNEAGESVKRFKEALYVRPSCWVAHFHLAEAYNAFRETEKARTEYGIVVKLLEKDGMRDPGLNLFALSIPAEQIVQMCKSRLARLSSSN